jgi:hypothetical protein
MVDAQCGDRGATRIRTRPVAFEEITALFLTNAAGPIYLARIFSTSFATVPALSPS